MPTEIELKADVGSLSPETIPSVTSEQSSDDVAADHGFLIVVDISDSSALPGRQLREVIQSLWRLPDDLSPVKLGNGAAASGILDGLIVAIPRARHERILSACCTIIERVRSDHNVLVRIAVHRGDFHRILDPPLIVGTAPNECSRMVRVAGPGQIVVSEAFVQSWVSEEGSLPPGLLFPGLSNPPWQIQQKPGTVSTLRLFVCPSEATDAFPQAQPPMPLQWIHQAEQGVRQVLSEIEYSFSSLVAEVDEAIRSNSLKTRVSLFAPDLSQRYLLPTEFRFVRSKRDQSFANVGRTKYRIGSPQDSIGPLGQAFARHSVQAVSGLPYFRQASGDYMLRLSEKPWNVPSEVVNQFGRKARAFLAIPFSLTSKAAPPEGVICIDTDHRLTGIPHEVLIDIGEAIELNYRIVLAALWRLRL